MKPKKLSPKQPVVDIPPLANTKTKKSTNPSHSSGSKLTGVADTLVTNKGAGTNQSHKTQQFIKSLRPGSHSQTTTSLLTTTTLTSNPNNNSKILHPQARSQLVRNQVTTTTTSSSELDLGRERQQRKMMMTRSPKRSNSNRQSVAASSSRTDPDTNYNPRLREQMLVHKSRDVLDRSMPTSESSPNQDDDDDDDDLDELTQIELTSYPRPGAKPVSRTGQSNSMRTGNKPMSSSPNSLIYQQQQQKHQSKSYPVARAYEGSDSGEDLDAFNNHRQFQHGQVVYENERRQQAKVDSPAVHFSSTTRVNAGDSHRRARNLVESMRPLSELNADMGVYQTISKSRRRDRVDGRQEEVYDDEIGIVDRRTSGRRVEYPLQQQQQLVNQQQQVQSGVSPRKLVKSSSSSSSLKIDPKYVLF